MFVRNPYNYDVDLASSESGLKCEDESLTLQSQGQDADINIIVKRFGVTGMLPQVALPPTYGNFSGVSDYRSALDLIKEAEESFMAMDAKVRNRFNNDPQLFVEFCDDPKNLEEMRKLGLAVPKVEDVKLVDKPA